MKNLVIIGCGGFGREVVEYVKLINEKEPTWNFLGFVDDNKEATTVEGYHILGGLDELYKMADKVFACIAIADINSRKRIVCECEQHGIRDRGRIHHCDRLYNGNQLSCREALYP